MIQQANESLKNRDILDSFLQNTPKVSCVLPTSGLSAVLDLPLGTNDKLFAQTLFEKTDTTVFPAGLFECPGSVRVSFSQDREITTEGFHRLSNFIRDWN